MLYESGEDHDLSLENFTESVGIRPIFLEKMRKIEIEQLSLFSIILIVLQRVKEEFWQ